jgi:hypothetical protein
MKLGNLILGVALIAGFSSFGQEEDKECLRMRFLAGEELKVNNYQGASMYYIKGETLCGGYDAANYARLIGSLRNAINNETDAARKTAYTDTLNGAYDRADKAGAYDTADDLIRGSYLLQGTKPNNVEADKFFVRGIAAQGVNTNEAYVSYHYYNLYSMWYAAPAEKKAELKKRLITEYFSLSKLITEANMSAKASENLTTYFNYIVRSCDDILPELKGFMSSLPQDKEVKTVTVKNFLNLLETKECTDSKEFMQLVDTLIAIDPTSFDAKMMKVKVLVSNKNYGAAISALRDAKEFAPDEATKQEIQYEIARAQFSQGSYSAAYSTAMSVSGEHKGKALIIAGQSVGQNANNCGSSTFERSCNNIYAVQLLQQGAALGASDGGAIGRYKARYPSADDCFQNGNPASVSLTCYGISVSPCN